MAQGKDPDPQIWLEEAAVQAAESWTEESSEILNAQRQWWNTQGTAERGGGERRRKQKASSRLKSDERITISHTKTDEENGKGRRREMTQVPRLSQKAGMHQRGTRSAWLLEENGTDGERIPF